MSDGDKTQVLAADTAANEVDAFLPTERSGEASSRFGCLVRPIRLRTYIPSLAASQIAAILELPVVTIFLTLLGVWL
jgi:hypothetical protein